MRKTAKILSIVLALMLALSVSVCANSPKEMTDSVSAWLTKSITVEESGSDIDSYLDQTVFAMQRCGNTSYSEKYKAYINGAVKAHFGEMYLSDFARISLSAMSCGINPKNVGGRNLLEAIAQADLAKEAFSGGVAFALIALHSANNCYTDRQAELKNMLLASQRSDGGFNAYLDADADASWTLGGETDSTGIVLQALAIYRGDAKVDAAIEKAVDFLKKEQMPDGGFGSWGSASAESISQVIAGLCAVGINPMGDEFKKDGGTMLSALSAFINDDGGARCWDGSSNIMTGYQLLEGLSAYERFADGSVGLYEMSTLSVTCHNVRNSFFGQRLPALASLICRVVTYFFNQFKIESYR